MAASCGSGGPVPPGAPSGAPPFGKKSPTKKPSFTGGRSPMGKR